MFMRRLQCLLLFGAVFLPAFASAAPPLTLSFERRAVVVTGATPHSDVVLIGITREPRLYSAHTIVRKLIRNDVANDPVRFDFDRDLADASIYAAVDTRTGAYAINVPAGYPLRLHAIPAAALRRNTSGGVLDLTLQLQWMEVLCVRPGGGSWTLSTLDGAANDGDQRPNGRVVITPPRMQHLAVGSPGLQTFTPHDVIIVLDPDTISAYATEIPQ